MNKIVKNKLSGRSRTKSASLSFLFKPKVIISLVLIGVFSFAALIALSGYAGDLRKDLSGSATVKSRSAIGYAGYAQLLTDMGYDIDLPANPASSQSSWDTQPLRIYTLVNPYQSETLVEIDNDDAAKLIILPKWAATRKLDKAGWVEKQSKRPTYRTSRLSQLLEDADINLALSQAGKDNNGEDYDIKFSSLDTRAYEDEELEDDDTEYEPLNYDLYTTKTSIDYLQSFDFLEVTQEADIILTADTYPILIRLADTQTYILSEPDLLNTQGISAQSRARLAVNILDVIAEYEGLTPQAASFDLSIHGLGNGRNIIKLMTLPPFLAATLCLLAAAGLIAWQAFSRFGDPLRRDPDFAQGPVSLAKSAAEFMAVSNRVQHMAPDYAQLTRQQVIRKMGLIGQSQDHINRAIAARETQRKISPSFEDLTVSLQQNTNTNLIEHARVMTRWKEEMIS